MKLTFRNPSAFTGAVAHAVTGLPGKAPESPVLAGMRITARGKTVSVSAFDFIVAAEARIGEDAVEVGEPGDVVVSGMLLAAMCRKLPDRQLTITGDGTVVRFECGQARFALLGLAGIEDYPALPEVPEAAGTVDAAELAGLIRQVAVASAREHADPVYTCVQIEADRERLTLSATDRYRMATGFIDYQPVTVEQPAMVLVPAARLAAWAKTLPAGSRVGISVGLGEDGAPVLAGFTCEDATMTTRVIPGALPSFGKMLSQPEIGKAVMDTADLQGALSLAVLADGVRVRLDFGPGCLIVESANSGTEAGDTVSVTYDGDPVAVHANPGHLADALGALGDERVAVTACEKLIIRITAPRDGEVTYSHVIQGLREVLPKAA